MPFAIDVKLPAAPVLKKLPELPPAMDIVSAAKILCKDCENLLQCSNKLIQWKAPKGGFSEWKAKWLVGAIPHFKVEYENNVNGALLNRWKQLDEDFKALQALAKGKDENAFNTKLAALKANLAGYEDDQKGGASSDEIAKGNAQAHLVAMLAHPEMTFPQAETIWDLVKPKK